MRHRWAILILLIGMASMLGLVSVQAGTTGAPLYVTPTDQLLLPVQGLQVPQVLLSHATDCTGGGVTGARYGNICVDRDDFRQWQCVQTLCSSPGHWREISAASAIRFTPAGTIAATDVAGALNELDTDARMSDKRAIHTHPTDCKGGAITARLGELCLDLDDGHLWECNSATCTTTNWIDGSGWMNRANLPAGWGLITTHATDCPANTPTGKLNDRCIDLDDGREWRCPLASCTLAAHWTPTAGVLWLAQQTTDPNPPPANSWLLYSKLTGIFTRESSGNINGPFGTGTGGGGGGTGLTARLVTTSNITLFGEITIEGILTSTSRVLVAGQTTPSQNGLYNTSGVAWTRTTDAAAGAAFATGTLVSISDGLTTPTGNKGSTWMYTSAGAYNTSNLSLIKTGVGPASELQSNKSIASGYMGLNTLGKALWNRLWTPAVHTDLSATSQIDVASLLSSQGANVVGIQNSGAGNVTLTTGNPRITGCSAGSGNNGVRLLIYGLHPTKTVTIPNGQGLLLAGNAGSVIIGQPTATPPSGGSLDVRCNESTTTWEQTGYVGLQQAKNAGASIGNAVDEASGVTIGDVASGTYCVMFASTTKCYCASSACDNIIQLSAGKSLIIRKSDGITTLASLANDTGTSTGFGTTVDRSVRVGRTALQTIPHNTDTMIAFDQEDFDTDTMHSTTTNNSRLTFTTGGKYIVMCRGRWAVNTSGAVRDAYIRLNGTTIISSDRFPTNATDPGIFVQAAVIYQFTAGDYVEMGVFQDSGSDLDFLRVVSRYPNCEASKLN